MNPSDKDIISIDIQRLDAEWLNIASDYHYYSDLLAAQSDKKKRMQANLKILESEFILRANRKGEKLLKCKPTVAVIEAYVSTRPTITDLRYKIISAEKKETDLKNIVLSLEIKKRALSDLTALWLNNYFVEGFSKEASAAKHAITKNKTRKTSDKIRKKLNKYSRKN